MHKKIWLDGYYVVESNSDAIIGSGSFSKDTGSVTTQLEGSGRMLNLNESIISQVLLGSCYYSYCRRSDRRKNIGLRVSAKNMTKDSKRYFPAVYFVFGRFDLTTGAVRFCGGKDTFGGADILWHVFNPPSVRCGTCIRSRHIFVFARQPLLAI